MNDGMSGEIQPGGQPPAPPNAAAATRDAVEKSKTQSFERFKKSIGEKTINEKHQIYVTHTDYSRKIASDTILNVLLKKAKLRGALHEEFPFRINPSIDTTEGKSKQAIHIFVSSMESYESCAKIESIEIDGHTLKVSTGDIFSQDIVKRKNMKRVTLMNVPVFCVIEFARQLADYVDIEDIEKDLQISAQGSMSTKVLGFKKPMPRYLHVNRNGYTVRAEVKVEGYTAAEIAKFSNLGLLNKPWSRPTSTPGVNAWRAGPAEKESTRVKTCYFCYEPGHTKHDCVKHKSWKAKMDLRVCNTCGEKGHIARWCKVQEQRFCDYCNEQGHIAPRCRKKINDAKLVLSEGNYPPLNDKNKSVSETGAADTSGASLETLTAENENVENDDMSDVMKQFYNTGVAIIEPNSAILTNDQVTWLEEAFKEPDEVSKVPYENPSEGEQLLHKQQLLEAEKKIQEAAAVAAANKMQNVSASRNKENHFFDSTAADNAAIFRAIQLEKSKKIGAGTYSAPRNSNASSLHEANVSRGSSQRSSRSSSRVRQGTQPYQMPAKKNIGKNTSLTVSGSNLGQKPTKGVKPVFK